MDNLTRRNIRYICFRLQTEAQGGSKATRENEGIMQYVDDVKKQIEAQPEFGGWLKFAKTWDVDDASPLVSVKRASSIQTQWNTILKEEAKELLAEKEEKGKKVSTRKQVKHALQEEVQKTKRQSKKASFWDRLK